MRNHGKVWDEHVLAHAIAAGASHDDLVRIVTTLPVGYKQAVSPHRAASDLVRLTQLTTDSDLDVRVCGIDDRWSMTVCGRGTGASLSHVVPAIGTLGVEVVDQQPYPVNVDGQQRYWIYDFGLRARGRGAPTGTTSDRFADAVIAIWQGHAEADSFNKLILSAGLNWREVALLRAYSAYLKQAGLQHGQSAVAQVLATHPEAAAMLVELFGAMFDPAESSADRAGSLRCRVDRAIDEVATAEADLILRTLVSAISATMRTNYYRRDDNGWKHPCLTLKFAADRIVNVPGLQPPLETFVSSPRVEGVHIRFGRVARGGLRWSNRVEDYRTEVLGLVRAQSVKNALTVPVGAKGGFIVKRPPTATGDPSRDQDLLYDEAAQCYRQFISGLLDITDNVNVASGAVEAPDDLVCRDGDDPYLVVAADKGTAKFSDIANEVAVERGFWLGDAFASGGSSGYDHKRLGITARGAWMSVRRHFREIGIDPDTDTFTVAGIGDMSGDVFGNGMLLSRNIKLVAAFDHRDIFVDPDPDPRRSFLERERLFRLQRSSWADFDPAAISVGGGVWARSSKRVPVSGAMRRVLGLGADIAELAPAQLIQAILAAPVDLLWNGGVGTYVKASGQNHAEAADKANDSVRVDADRVRARVIVEGGNLGVTPLGRVEFALGGGRVNSDAIDNSAGVDSSDHEVNIKILLDGLVRSGTIEAADRIAILDDVADEVVERVLAHNAMQNAMLGVSRTDTVALAGVDSRVISAFERDRSLIREVEGLPADSEIADRRHSGRGLSSPELAVMMALVKIQIKTDLLDGDLPDAAHSRRWLAGYFPARLQTEFPDAIGAHPLRREIIATALANEVVGYGGISYAHRMFEEASATTEDAVRAYLAATSIFELRPLWQRIRGARGPAGILDRLELITKRTLDRAARWLLTSRPQPLAINAELQRYRHRVQELRPLIAVWRPPAIRHRDAIDDYVNRGAPRELTREVLHTADLWPVLDIVDIADIVGRDLVQVGETYFALHHLLGVDDLQRSISGLPRAGRWEALARLALRDEVSNAVRAVTLTVMRASDVGDPAAQAVSDWADMQGPTLARVRCVLGEVSKIENLDLAAATVAARALRTVG